jgi:hypothetical protein
MRRRIVVLRAFSVAVPVALVLVLGVALALLGRRALG